MYSKVLIWTSGLALCLSGSGCGKKSNDSSSSAAEETSITLTGQLALSGGESSLRLTGTSVDDLSMYCVSFTVPPVAGTGDFDAEGKFTVTLDTTGVSVGCFILDPDEAILGTLVFKDPAKKDLKGGSKSSDRLAFEGGESNLGSIVLNLDTGTAEVDISQIVLKTKSVETVAAEGELYDFTGSYKFAQADLETLPAGYSKLCTMSEQDGKDGEGGKDCKGPADGMPLYFKLISGVSTTNASEKVHAASLWASKTVDDLCGNKLGLTYAQAKEKGVDFTSSGVTEGTFNWAANLTDGWKDETNARAQHSLMKMENVDNFKGYPGTKQYFKQYRTWTCEPGSPCSESQTPIVAAGFSFFANSKESGCRDAAGKPIQLNNWDGMQCENTQLTGDSAGLQKNVCKKTVDNAVITCTHIQGTFLENGTVLENAMTRFPEDFVVYATGAYCDYNSNNAFDGDEWPMYNGDSQSCNNNVTIKQGSLCKDIVTTDAPGKLAQLRCYADYMHKSGDGRGGDEVTACKREINTNWGAQTPEEFLLNSDGPSRAQGQYVFELFDYDSPTSGSLRGEDTYFDGIQVGNNWTECEVREVFSISVKKLDDAGNLYGEMVTSETNVSPKPACVAEYGQGKTTKYVFKMLKQ
jgi:hypothetical protein